MSIKKKPSAVERKRDLTGGEKVRPSGQVHDGGPGETKNGPHKVTPNIGTPDLQQHPSRPTGMTKPDSVEHGPARSHPSGVTPATAPMLRGPTSPRHVPMSGQAQDVGGNADDAAKGPGKSPGHVDHHNLGTHDGGASVRPNVSQGLKPTRDYQFSERGKPAPQKHHAEHSYGSAERFMSMMPHASHPTAVSGGGSGYPKGVKHKIGKPHKPGAGPN